MSAIMNTYGRYGVSFVRGENAFYWDAHGRKYIDFCSGISVTNLGNCNPTVTEAICRQAQMLVHTSNLFEIEQQEELAGLISKNSFGGKVFFCNSGAEANEGAIKAARMYGNKKHGGARYKIISMFNSFHGRTYATLSATGQAKIQKGFTPIAGYNVYVPFNDFEAFQQAASFGDTAAVIIELYQGEGGVVPACKNYIKELRKFCADNDILFIIDEIQTGYGRTGKLFAYEHFGIEPDIMTLAKAIANGLPMGAFVAKDSVAQYMTAGTHGSTFGGNHLVCAAGLAVIKEMTKHGFLDEVARKGKLLHDTVSLGLGAECSLRGEGLLIGVETKHAPNDVVKACLEAGLVVVPAGNNSVRLYPPLTADDVVLKEGAQIYIDTIKKLDSVK